jgi:hypothetical protein
MLAAHRVTLRGAGRHPVGSAGGLTANAATLAALRATCVTVLAHPDGGRQLPAGRALQAPTQVTGEKACGVQSSFPTGRRPQNPGGALREDLPLDQLKGVDRHANSETIFLLILPALEFGSDHPFRRHRSVRILSRLDFLDHRPVIPLEPIHLRLLRTFGLFPDPGDIGRQLVLKVFEDERQYLFHCPLGNRLGGGRR